MHCRSYMLLHRDWKELYNNNYEGITATPVSEDMMKWEAEIEGLQDSVWHGVAFQLTIDFTPEYNLAPPEVKFITIPFHPNVDPHTGEPSINFLNNRDKWNPSYTLSSILLALQVLLSNPILEKPVNLDAAQILMRDESMYRTIIEKLFKEPLEENDSPEPSENSYKLTGGENLCVQRGHSANTCRHSYEEETKAVSFNDYYKTWSEIATSKTTERSRAPLLEDPLFMRKYYKWRRQDLHSLKSWRINFAAAKFRLAREKTMPVNRNILKILGSSAPGALPLEPQYDIDINAMIYETENAASMDDTYSDESWEDEVADLVKWTHALDVDTLED